MNRLMNFLFKVVLIVGFVLMRLKTCIILSLVISDASGMMIWSDEASSHDDDE